MSFFTEPLSVGNIWDSIKSWFLPKFLKTICPHCQKIYRLPFKYDDKYIECPNCKESFWVDRYLIPVRFSGKPTTDYEEKISEILENLELNKRQVKIENFEGSLYLYVKNDKYLISFNDLLYSAEKDIPRWKIKKILIYFCTEERDWKSMTSWSTDENLWKEWDKIDRKRQFKKLGKYCPKGDIFERISVIFKGIGDIADLITIALKMIVLIALVALGVASCVISCSDSSNSGSSAAAKRYLEGFGEQLIKEETGLDSNVRMNFNENTVKYSFDVKYRD